MRNDRHPEVNYDIFSMVFVILPRFNKSEDECETVVDKILFSLKNGHNLKGIPKSFREKEFKEIFEVAKVSNFTGVELAKWEAAMMNRYDYETSMRDIEKRGFGKGVMRTAKNMLLDGLDPTRVARITKLPVKQIKAIRSA
jgi:hypothetical protein